MKYFGRDYYISFLVIATQIWKYLFRLNNIINNSGNILDFLFSFNKL